MIFHTRCWLGAPKLLIWMVARDRIELPTRGFSARGPKRGKPLTANRFSRVDCGIFLALTLRYSDKHLFRIDTAQEYSTGAHTVSIGNSRCRIGLRRPRPVSSHKCPSPDQPAPLPCSELGDGLLDGSRRLQGIRALTNCLDPLQHSPRRNDFNPELTGRRHEAAHYS